MSSPFSYLGRRMGSAMADECAQAPLLAQETRVNDASSHDKYRPDVQLLPDTGLVSEEGHLRENGQADPGGDAAVVLPDFKTLFSSETLWRKDELRRFRSSLFWLGLDQSTGLRIGVSFLICLTAVLLEPLLETFYVECPNCDEQHSHPFEVLVQCSESGLALVSFLFLSNTLRKNGLRKVLLLDKLVGEPAEVREGYTKKLHSAFRMLGLILLPCFLIELLHKGWWFAYVEVDIPYLTLQPLENAVICAVAMLSWLYKTTVFLFVCILFRLMCSLQILRLQAYNRLLETTPNVALILSRHFLIHKQLSHISHRFRTFLVASLLTITFSQFISLFVITASPGIVNFFRAGDLAVCSITQLTGIVICLHGAARITHRAQGIVSIVSRWHAAATCWPDALAVRTSSDVPIAEPFSAQDIGPAHPWLQDDDLEASYVVCANPLEATPHDPAAYQKRQSLVTYLQHSPAAFSLYGFIVDRSSIARLLL